MRINDFKASPGWVTIQKYDNTIAQKQLISNILQINIREAIEFVRIAWNQVRVLYLIIWLLKPKMFHQQIELVNRFPIVKKLEWKRLSLLIQKILSTTESIIATIEGEDLSESEDSPIVKSISHKSALEHVNSLLLYITQDCDSEL